MHFKHRREHVFITRLHLKELFLSFAGAYLNFTNEAFGSLLHPLYLLHLINFFMASPVVSTLAPDINMLAPVTRVPLDLLHLVVCTLLAPRLESSHPPWWKEESNPSPDRGHQVASLVSRIESPGGQGRKPLLAPLARHSVEGRLFQLLPRRGQGAQTQATW